LSFARRAAALAGLFALAACIAFAAPARPADPKPTAPATQAAPVSPAAPAPRLGTAPPSPQGGDALDAIAAMVNDEAVLASDVEDLQLALFYDGNGNGVVDALEYPGAAAEYESKSWSNDELREVRVTVVARTRSQDPDVLANPNLASSVTQGFENRPAGVATDGFRRRSITLTVQPRNVDRVL